MYAHRTWMCNSYFNIVMSFVGITCCEESAIVIRKHSVNGCYILWRLILLSGRKLIRSNWWTYAFWQTNLSSKALECYTNLAASSYLNIFSVFHSFLPFQWSRRWSSLMQQIAVPSKCRYRFFECNVLFISLWSKIHTSMNTLLWMHLFVLHDMWYNCISIAHNYTIFMW